MVNGTAGAAAAVAVGAISRLNMVSPTHNLPPSVWRVHSVDDPLLKMDLALFALFFTLFGLFDYCFAQRTKARWWLLHLFANALVCIVGFRDCVRTVIDPANCVYSLDYSVAPTYIVAAIHAYHMMAFSELSSEDIFHHLMFVPAICGISLLVQAGPLVSLVGFFMSGLPGGLDYAMLAMEKHGLLDRETEKLWNARINVWIRAPGLSYVTFCIYNSMLYFPIGISASQFLAAIVVSLLCILNGQYYMQKVVGNTARKVRTYSC